MACRSGTLLLAALLMLAPSMFVKTHAQTSEGQSAPEQVQLDVPTVSQVELTGDAARRAIDTFLEIQEKYGNTAFNDPANPKAFVDSVRAAGVYDQVVAELAGHGFHGVEEWATTFASIGLAASFVREGQDPESVDRQIADLENDETIPQAMKESTIAMLRQMRPTENNVAIAKGLIDDPAYKDKVDRVLTMENPGEVE
jgi:hypothetical protein